MMERRSMPVRSSLSLLTGLLFLASGCAGWFGGPGTQGRAKPSTFRVYVASPGSQHPELLKPALPEAEYSSASLPRSYFPDLIKPPLPELEPSGETFAEAPQLSPPAAMVRPFPEDGRRMVRPTPSFRKTEKEPRVWLLSNSPASAEQVELNFDDAEINSVIRAIGELAGINYIIHPAVKGNVTVRTVGKIPVEELIPTLEQILAVNNFTMVEVGGLYRVVPIAQAQKEPIAARLGAEARDLPEVERFVIQVVPLRFVSTAAMQEVVKPLLSQSAALIAVKGTNNLLVVDTSSNVRKVLKVVKLLDTSTFDRFHTKLYPLDNADPETLSKELSQMFTALGYGDKQGAALEFMPIPRLNAVLVVNGLPELAPAVELWVSQLDQPVQRGEEQTYVYYVQHGSAENLATILQSVFLPSEGAEKREAAPAGDIEPGRRKIIPPKTEEQTEAAPTPTPTFQPRTVASAAAGSAGEIRLFVVPDPDTNSLILRTKPVNYPSILAVVRKLDRKPRQVIIEALVAEVQLTGDLELGLEYALRQVDSSSGGTTTVGQLGNVLAAPATLPLATDAAAATSSGGLSVFITNPNRFLGTLDALAEDNNLNIVSSPSILTSENKEAEINVVTEVPIARTTTDPNTQTTRTDFEFREVGVKLKITPKINENRFVTLEIAEELSEIGPRTEGEDAPPNFNSREAKTTVVLKDNQSLIIGGLISERVSEEITGIPFLNRLPILKYIFGSTEISKRKTELMVMLTPRVVFDETDSRAVTDLYNERLKGVQKLMKEKNIRRP